MKMSINNSTIGWGIIGRSSGLQTKTAGCIAGFDIKNLVDIHNTYINIYPNTELYCLFRENRNNCTVSYYINYRPAKEIKSDRNGAFYGSVLVLVNSRVESDIAYTILKELSDYLGTYINSENKFVKNVDEIDIIEPNSLATITTALTSISPSINIGNNEGFMLLENLDKNNICNFFAIAEDINTSYYFSKVYASSSREIAKFVKSREKIVVFEPTTLKLQFEIDKIKSEKILLEKKLIEVSNETNKLITDYEQRLRQLEINKKSSFEENSTLKNQIRQLQNKDNSKVEIENLKRKIHQLDSEKIRHNRDYENLKMEYNKLKQSGSQIINHGDSDEPEHSAFDDIFETINSYQKEFILLIVVVILVVLLIRVILQSLDN
jgi:hypothetical protein